MHVSRGKFQDNVAACLNSTMGKAACNEDRKTDKVRLEVFLESTSYFVYAEAPVYTIWDFIGNVGGVIGMAAGMSIFSIVEIVFHVGQILFVLATGKGY